MQAYRGKMCNGTLASQHRVSHSVGGAWGGALPHPMIFSNPSIKTNTSLRAPPHHTHTHTHTHSHTHTLKNEDLPTEKQTLPLKSETPF